MDWGLHSKPPPPTHSFDSGGGARNVAVPTQNTQSTSTVSGTSSSGVTAGASCTNPSSSTTASPTPISSISLINQQKTSCQATPPRTHTLSSSNCSNPDNSRTIGWGTSPPGGSGTSTGNQTAGLSSSPWSAVAAHGTNARVPNSSSTNSTSSMTPNHTNASAVAATCPSTASNRSGHDQVIPTSSVSSTATTALPHSSSAASDTGAAASSNGNNNNSNTIGNASSKPAAFLSPGQGGSASAQSSSSRPASNSSIVQQAPMSAAAAAPHQPMPPVSSYGWGVAAAEPSTPWGSNYQPTTSATSKQASSTNPAGLDASSQSPWSQSTLPLGSSQSTSHRSSKPEVQQNTDSLKSTAPTPANTSATHNNNTTNTTTKAPPAPITINPLNQHSLQSSNSWLANEPAPRQPSNSGGSGVKAPLLSSAGASRQIDPIPHGHQKLNIPNATSRQSSSGNTPSSAGSKNPPNWASIAGAGQSSGNSPGGSGPAVGEPGHRHNSSSTSSTLNSGNKGPLLQREEGHPRLMSSYNNHDGVDASGAVNPDQGGYGRRGARRGNRYDSYNRGQTSYDYDRDRAIPYKMPDDPIMEQQILGGSWGRKTVNQDTGWDTTAPSASQREWGSAAANAGPEGFNNNGNPNSHHPAAQNQGTEAWGSRNMPNNRRAGPGPNVVNKPLLPGHPQGQVSQSPVHGYQGPTQGASRMQSPPTNGWRPGGGGQDSRGNSGWDGGQSGPSRGHRSIEAQNNDGTVAWGNPSATDRSHGDSSNWGANNQPRAANPVPPPPTNGGWGDRSDQMPKRGPADQSYGGGWNDKNARVAPNHGHGAGQQHHPNHGGGGGNAGMAQGWDRGGKPPPSWNSGSTVTAPDPAHGWGSPPPKGQSSGGWTAGRSGSQGSGGRMPTNTGWGQQDQNPKLNGGDPREQNSWDTNPASARPDYPPNPKQQQQQQQQQQWPQGRTTPTGMPVRKSPQDSHGNPENYSADDLINGRLPDLAIQKQEIRRAVEQGLLPDAATSPNLFTEKNIPLLYKLHMQTQKLRTLQDQLGRMDQTSEEAKRLLQEAQHIHEHNIVRLQRELQENTCATTGGPKDSRDEYLGGYGRDRHSPNNASPAAGMNPGQRHSTPTSAHNGTSLLGPSGYGTGMRTPDTHNQGRNPGQKLNYGYPQHSASTSSPVSGSNMAYGKQGNSTSYGWSGPPQRPSQSPATVNQGYGHNAPTSDSQGAYSPLGLGMRNGQVSGGLPNNKPPHQNNTNHPSSLPWSDTPKPTTSNSPYDPNKMGAGGAQFMSDTTKKASSVFNIPPTSSAQLPPTSSNAPVPLMSAPPPKIDTPPGGAVSPVTTGGTPTGANAAALSIVEFVPGRRVWEGQAKDAADPFSKFEEKSTSESANSATRASPFSGSSAKPSTGVIGSGWGASQSSPTLTGSSFSKSPWNTTQSSGGWGAPGGSSSTGWGS